MRIICGYCERPISGKKETVGNVNLHPDCLDEVSEVTEPMFRQKLDLVPEIKEGNGKSRNLNGTRRGQQDNPARTRAN
jgi:hypothetical protein